MSDYTQQQRFTVTLPTGPAPQQPTPEEQLQKAYDELAQADWNLWMYQNRYLIYAGLLLVGGAAGYWWGKQ